MFFDLVHTEASIRTLVSMFLSFWMSQEKHGNIDPNPDPDLISQTLQQGVIQKVSEDTTKT